MDAEEWGRRPDADTVGYLMFLPKLCDLFSLRWYSIGDWRAVTDRKRGLISLMDQTLTSEVLLKKQWALAPFRKFLWLSKIWTTSSSQACCISGDEACMMKRVKLPSVPREVRTRQHGSSSECFSTPKQLTCRAHRKEASHNTKPKTEAYEF